MTSFSMENLNIGYEDVFNYIGSKDSIVPKSLFFKLVTSIGGDTAEQLNVSSKTKKRIIY
jgi:hypothetical protein